MWPAWEPHRKARAQERGKRAQVRQLLAPGENQNLRPQVLTALFPPLLCSPAVQSRLALNSCRPSCLGLLCAEITGVRRHAWLHFCRFRQQSAHGHRRLSSGPLCSINRGESFHPPEAGRTDSAQAQHRPKPGQARVPVEPLPALSLGLSSPRSTPKSHVAVSKSPLPSLGSATCSSAASGLLRGRVDISPAVLMERPKTSQFSVYCEWSANWGAAEMMMIWRLLT